MKQMSHRERILAALSCKPVDVVPFDISGTKTTSLSTVAERNLKTLIGMEYESEYGNYKFQRMHMPEQMARYFDVDVRRVGESFPNPLPPEITAPVQTDNWGIEWTQTPVGTYIPTRHPLAGATGAHDLRTYPWPDPEAWQPAALFAEKARQYRAQTDCAVCIDLPDCVVQIAQYLRGTEQWMVDTVVDKPFAALLMEYVADIYAAMVAQVMRAVGDAADFVLIPDDLGDQKNLLVRPAVYRELIKPLHARIFAAVKANSPAKVVLHSCGAVRSVIGDLIDIGVDGLNPVQVSARGMDTAELSAEYGGKICFWGGIDSQSILPNGTPDDVRGEVRRRIQDMAECGGYVVASVHIIQPEVPPENILAMAEAAHRYGGRSDGARFRPENTRAAALAA